MTIALDRAPVCSLLVGRSTIADGERWDEFGSYLDAFEVNVGDVTDVGNAATDGVIRTASLTVRNGRVGGVSDGWSAVASVAGAPVLFAGDAVVAHGADDAAVEWLTVLFGVHTYALVRQTLNPLDTVSPLNYYGLTFLPPFFPKRELALSVAFPAKGVAPVAGDWTQLFYGLMGAPAVEPHTLTVPCADGMRQLQRKIIEVATQYGSAGGTALETVLNQLLVANLGTAAPTLYPLVWDAATQTHVSGATTARTAFLVRTGTIDAQQSLYDALWSLVAQIGWWVGFWWWPDGLGTSVGEYRLTLLEPPRGKTAVDHTFTAAEVKAAPFSVDDSFVRNRVMVTYKDIVSGARKTVTVQDNASIDFWGGDHTTPAASDGVYTCWIEEADASAIDTNAEALEMANAALFDLKDLYSGLALSLPFCPTLRPFDLISVTEPSIALDEGLFGVLSVRHVWANNELTTEAACAGKVIGNYGRWLHMESRPHVKKPVTGGDISTHTVMPAPTWVSDPPAMGIETVDDTQTAYAALQWAKPAGEYYPALYVIQFSVGGSPFYEVQTTGTSYRLDGLPLSSTLALSVAGVSVEGVLGAAATLATVATPSPTVALTSRDASAYQYNSHVLRSGVGTYLTVAERADAANGVNEYGPTNPRVAFGGAWSAASPVTYIGSHYGLFIGWRYADGTTSATALPEYTEITWKQYGTAKPKLRGTVSQGNWATTPPSIAARLELYSWSGSAWVLDTSATQAVPIDGQNELNLTLANGTTYRLRAYVSCLDDPYANQFAQFAWTFGGLEVSETLSAGADVKGIAGRQVRIAGGWAQLSGYESAQIAAPTGTQYWRIYLEEVSDGVYVLRASGPQATLAYWSGEDFWRPDAAGYAANRVELGRVAWTAAGSPTLDYTYNVYNPFARWQVTL